MEGEDVVGVDVRPVAVPDEVAGVDGGVTAVDSEEMREERAEATDEGMAVVSNERMLSGRGLVLSGAEKNEPSEMTNWPGTYAGMPLGVRTLFGGDAATWPTTRAVSATRLANFMAVDASMGEEMRVVKSSW